MSEIHLPSFHLIFRQRAFALIFENFFLISGLSIVEMTNFQMANRLRIRNLQTLQPFKQNSLPHVTSFSLINDLALIISNSVRFGLWIKWDKAALTFYFPSTVSITRNSDLPRNRKKYQKNVKIKMRGVCLIRPLDCLREKKRRNWHFLLWND